MFLYINMKNYKNIAYIDFVNVIIALNSHAYEKKFLTTVRKKVVSFVALWIINSKTVIYLLSNYNRSRASRTA